MDIAEAVTTEYREFDAETPVSKLLGAFQTHRDPGLLIGSDDGIVGVVTRNVLINSQHDPDQKARSVMRDDVPHVDRSDDIREVARRMVESEFTILPVYDGDDFAGVVTNESVAAATEQFLDAVDVSDVYSRDLRSVGPETTLGEVIHELRTNAISRVPVIDDDGDAVGMISTFDLLEFTIRETKQEQGGHASGFGEGSASGDTSQTHGGFGERAGVESRLLDLPARDVMNSPVATTGPTTGLGEAVHEMLDDDYSSLLVEIPAEGADGIVTLTDVLRSLTWTPDEEGTRLQVFGARYLTSMTRRRSPTSSTGSRASTTRWTSSRRTSSSTSTRSASAGRRSSRRRSGCSPTGAASPAPVRSTATRRRSAPPATTSNAQFWTTRARRCRNDAGSAPRGRRATPRLVARNLTREPARQPADSPPVRRRPPPPR
ncbi:CBS domain-containing protein [Halosimplex aquaticum]